jgi:hypothetical protein
MARCPDCNKFTSYAGDEEPELEDATVDDEGGWNASVRLHKDCGDCGTELAETTFDIDGQVDLDGDHAKHDGFEIDVEDLQQSEDSEGTGRGRRTYYGFTAIVRITCSCGVEVYNQEHGDRCQASSLDQLT